MRRSLAASFAALALSLPLVSTAKAQGMIDEIKFGVLAHDVPGLWSGFRLEKGTDLNGEVLFRPMFHILGATVRPAIGGSFNTGNHTSRVYADARFQWNVGSSLFFAVGLGAGVHNGKLDPTDADRKALGSRILFHIPVEVGLHLSPTTSFSVYFEHMSNASTAKYNEGLDAIGIRYGRRF